MDPADYVYTPDFSHMVVLRDGTDSRAWRVWDVVLEQFRAMGATRTSMKAGAWRLQHDADFHRRRASNVGPGPRDVRPRVVWEHTALDLSPIARRRALSCCAQHMLVAVLKGETLSVVLGGRARDSARLSSSICLCWCMCIFCLLSVGGLPLWYYTPGRSGCPYELVKALYLKRCSALSVVRNAARMRLRWRY